MNAISIVAIGGLSLLFLAYFSGGTCIPDQPRGGALCFPGFDKLGKGSAQTSGGGPAATSSGNNCQFLGNGQVCWFGSVGQGCINSNASASDWTTTSGRNTLCSRARTAYVNASQGANRPTNTASPHRHPAMQRRNAAKTAFARSYGVERLSIA